jgi:hypothetical protein
MLPTQRKKKKPEGVAGQPTAAAAVKKTELEGGEEWEDGGYLGGMYSRYEKAEAENPDCDDAGERGLKDAVLQWTSSYYVAYALIMTIGFALIFSAPEPRPLHSLTPKADASDAGYGLKAKLHWRPQSDDVDAIVLLLYYVFALMVCYDSTWGTLMSAEWGVRAPAIPRHNFKKFLKSLTAKRLEGYGGATSKRSWGIHCCDMRARLSGDIICEGANCGGFGSGIYRYDSFDGYWNLGRTVQGLFGAAAAYLYLAQGLCHCILCLVFYAALLIRAKDHLHHLLHAVYNDPRHGGATGGEAPPSASDATPSASLL